MYTIYTCRAEVPVPHLRPSYQSPGLRSTEHPTSRQRDGVGGGYFALIHGGWVGSDADTTNKVTRKATVALSAEEQRAQNLRVDSLACTLCSFPFTRLPQDTSDGLTRTFPLEGPSWRRTPMRRAPRKAPKVP